MTSFDERAIRNLLTPDALGEAEIAELLGPVGFEDATAAHRALIRITRVERGQELFQPVLAQLLSNLSEISEPDRVLINIERLVTGSTDPRRLLSYFDKHPRSIEMLTALIESSQFMTEILLRNPNYFELLSEHRHLARSRTAKEYCAQALDAVKELQESTKNPTFADALSALRRLQRWELLRLGVCDLLDLFDLKAVTSQLSALADGLIESALRISLEHAEAPDSRLAVIALGKLGGTELNYSSDIDLIFICAEEPTRYEDLGKKLIHVLTQVTPEGFLYRVDMRLRPWGKTGALVSSFDGYLDYLKSSAKPWELQALIKARCVAGDRELGRRFIEAINPHVFAEQEDGHRTYIYLLKQRTEEYLKESGKERGHVKLGEGSIRDIEFVTQALQLEHGHAHENLHQANTLIALQELLNSEFISPAEHRTLSEGYRFLRILEHQLQLMHHQQTHSLPSDSVKRHLLARRLGYTGDQANQKLSQSFRDHAQAIRFVYEKYLSDSHQDSETDFYDRSELILEHLSRLAPTYAEVFDEEEIELHSRLAARLESENLVELDIKDLGERQWQVSIISFDYFGELSLICGLLFAHGFDIQEGQVFTYEKETDPDSSHDQSSRRKIVDVFIVQVDRGSPGKIDWDLFSNELDELISDLENRRIADAKGKLLKQIAQKFSSSSRSIQVLAPVEIRIDNDSSDDYTILHISASNTLGFLYELANALSFFEVNIERVEVMTIGQQVKDTIHIQGADRKKVMNSKHLQELKTAAALVKHFTHILPQAPDPEMAMTHFREFMSDLFDRSNWTEELASIEQPQVITALSQVLGGSDFLWHDFLRMQYDNLLPLFHNLETLETPKPQSVFQNELSKEIADAIAKTTRLARYKESELARIDLRYILGYAADIREFSQELSDLAEVVVNQAYSICQQSLEAEFGTPLLEDSTECQVAICALGKCGGRELGFASDLELMFVYAGNGKTTGPRITSTAEFFERLVQEFLVVMKTKQKGAFEVDLQLRPFGKSGNVAVSLEAFKSYFHPEGAAWPYERQSLIRLRPIGGDANLGKMLTSLRDQFVFSGEVFNTTAMRAMRERQIRHMVKPNIFNAKLSTGGLVDLEYLVQGLQISNGKKRKGLRGQNTLSAMGALEDEKVITKSDRETLEEAYLFLGKLINALRMVRGHAEDLNVPQLGSQEFVILARRLGYMDTDPTLFHQDIEYYAERVRQLNEKYLN